MKFDCKEISINDEEFGCTLTLSEKEYGGIAEMNMTTEELMNSSGQYLMLQRTYTEGEFEKDNYYIETSEPDKSGKLKEFSVEIFREQFIMNCNKGSFEININVDNKIFEELKLAVKKIFNNGGQLNFHY